MNRIRHWQQNGRRRRVLRGGIIAGLLTAILAGCGPRCGLAAEGDDVPLALRPYRVDLKLAVDLPLFSGEARESLRDEILKSFRRRLGLQWTVDLTDAPQVQPISADGLRRCAESNRRLDRHELLVAVHQDGSEMHVNARAEHPVTGVSDIVTEYVFDPRDLPEAIVRSCYLAVRPVGLIDSVDGTTARVILQAGELRVPEESLSVDATCRLFEPILVMQSREGLIERVQPIPWTVLKLESRAGGLATCEVWSGLRSALGGKQRSRVQVLAVGVRARERSTRLELVTQTRPPLPLAAHRIELRSSAVIPRADAEDANATLLATHLTDRRGYVTLPRETSGSKANDQHKHEIVWAFAYSGRQLLARVPIVPGLVRTQRLEVPDDSARLAAEAALARLQGQVIEAVAERNTAAARVRAAIKKNQSDAARAAAADLRSLPELQVYLDRVTEIRVPAVKAAQSRRDRAGEVRIGRMCDELAELIKVYLSEDKRRAVFEELKELDPEASDSDTPAAPAAKPVISS